MVGFDGIDYSMYFHPSITTIVQPVEEMGKKSIDLLFDLLKNKTLKMMFALLMTAVIIYIIYKVINLIITPTDVFMVENGTVSVEETTVRIHH